MQRQRHVASVLIFTLLLVFISSCGKKTSEPDQHIVAAPIFDPPGGSFEEAQSVTITCSTSGATIYYSSNGADPTTISAIYDGTIIVPIATTIKAMACKDGWTTSPISTATYNVTQTVAVPVFDPPDGTYDDAQNVSITCDTRVATIRYTTDGSDPTFDSEIYSSPISILSTTTIRAQGFKEGWAPSSISSASYSILPAPFEMVYIPGGTFSMGDTRGGGQRSELPIHSVTLNPFYLDKYLVTQVEYAALMGSNPAYNNGVGYTYPVYFVSWYSAIKYCNLRSMDEGLAPVYSISGSTDPAVWGPVPGYDHATWDATICDWTADGYRLPTEAEWEYAAKGASDDPDYLYSGSDDPDLVAWYNGNNSPLGTKPVGGKAPNALGFYDMSGNLSEWCWDWWDDRYYRNSPSDNPTGPVSPSVESIRVARGGSFLTGAASCRVSARGGSYMAAGSNGYGFRLCRSAQ